MNKAIAPDNNTYTHRNCEALEKSKHLYFWDRYDVLTYTLRYIGNNGCTDEVNDDANVNNVCALLRYTDDRSR